MLLVPIGNLKKPASEVSQVFVTVAKGLNSVTGNIELQQNTFRLVADEKQLGTLFVKCLAQFSLYQVERSDSYL